MKFFYSISFLVLSLSFYPSEVIEFQPEESPHQSAQDAAWDNLSPFQRCCSVTCSGCSECRQECCIKPLIWCDQRIQYCGQNHADDQCRLCAKSDGHYFNEQDACSKRLCALSICCGCCCIEPSNDNQGCFCCDSPEGVDDYGCWSKK